MPNLPPLLLELHLQTLDLINHCLITAVTSLLDGRKGTFRLHTFFLNPRFCARSKALQDQPEEVLIEHGALELEELLRIGQIDVPEILDV